LFAETQTKQYSKAVSGKGLVYIYIYNLTSAVAYTLLKHAADYHYQERM